jgi:site-specific recombinase XerD
LKFVRKKTAKSNRGFLKEISVPISEYAKGVITLYANKDQNSESFVFPIHSDDENDETNRKHHKNFTRYINQHMSRLGKSVGVNKPISYQMARHSFATQAIRNGLSMEFVGDSLGHSNIKTTQNYFSGFEDETKKGIAEKLMEF